MSNTIKQLKDAQGNAFDPQTSIEALTTPSTGGGGNFLTTKDIDGVIKVVDTEISLEDVIQTVTVGQTTTGEPGTNAEVVNSGTGANPVLDFTIPRGEAGQDGQPGAPGPANTLSIGTVTNGEQAAASITGDAPNQQLNLVLPKGEQGEPGQNAVNPFKGWYDAVVTGEAGSRVVTSETQNLPANPAVGDYAYVKTWEISGTAPSQTETPTAKIYECTTAGTWSDSGRTVDTTNVQTFQTGEEVNETPIDDTHLDNPPTGSLAKAEDIPTLVKKVYSEGENPPDLYISDEAGNALVEVGDGHIKTKNFDSRNLQNVTMEVVDTTLKITIQ